MKRISYLGLALVALSLLAIGVAFAAEGRDCTPPVNTPAPVGAVLNLRTFNDCPGSTLTTLNNYPSQILIEDADEGCVGWANLHGWSFSEDGFSPAVFENCSHYQFSCVFKGCGTGAVAEGGLRLSPWWALDVDGRFMCRINGNGEIAVFGGRLPFYSFTSAYGLTYQPCTPIWLQITYNPHALTLAAPATIQYKIFYNGVNYDSPELAFDQANPAEDPPHGLWGELFPARAGGYFQLPGGNGGAAFDMTATWDNITYTGPQATATHNSTWGSLKSLYR